MRSLRRTVSAQELREAHRRSDWTEPDSILLLKAAHAIEELESEVKRLRQQREGWRRATVLAQDRLKVLTEVQQ